MKNRDPKSKLKALSWSYIILAVLVLILLVVMNLIPGFAEKAKEITGEEYPVLAFNTQLIVSILIYIWYFWLAGSRSCIGYSWAIFCIED